MKIPGKITASFKVEVSLIATNPSKTMKREFATAQKQLLQY
jgi:hypothetical protein